MDYSKSDIVIVQIGYLVCKEFSYFVIFNVTISKTKRNACTEFVFILCLGAWENEWQCYVVSWILLVCIYYI